MYNPYLPQTFDAVEAEYIPPSEKQTKTSDTPSKGGLRQLLKSLKLDDLDTGDVLLLLILLFLFLDDREDNLELLITLGLMLIL